MDLAALLNPENYGEIYVDVNGWSRGTTWYYKSNKESRNVENAAKGKFWNSQDSISEQSARSKIAEIQI